MVFENKINKKKKKNVLTKLFRAFKRNVTNWDAGQYYGIILNWDFWKKFLPTKFSWNVQILARWKYKKICSCIYKLK